MKSYLLFEFIPYNDACIKKWKLKEYSREDCERSVAKAAAAAAARPKYKISFRNIAQTSIMSSDTLETGQEATVCGYKRTRCEEENRVKAYVQFDWTASPVCAQTEAVLVADYQTESHEFLKKLDDDGVSNTATWHLKSQGVLKSDANKSCDALRNTRQVREADVVITRLIRKEPHSKHWGSIGVMCYAIALGKPCYVIAADDCVVWRHHMMNHPLVIRCADTADLLNKLHCRAYSNQ